MAEPDLDLAGLLARRLLPWAMTVAAVIGAGLPVTYYVLESAATQREATSHARELATSLESLVIEHQALWTFPAEKHVTLIGSFIRDKNLLAIHVEDARGEEIAELTYHASDVGAWWNTCVDAASAPIRFNNREVGTVQVFPSHLRLWVMTAIFAVLSTVGGVALGAVVYVVPVRIVRGMERRIHDLVDAVEQSNAELARRASDLSTLLEVARATGSTLEEADLFELIADHAVRACGVDRCSIFLRDGADGSTDTSVRLVVIRGADALACSPPGGDAGEVMSVDPETAFAHAMRNGAPVFPPETLDVAVPTDAVVPPSGRVVAILPLVHRERALGVLLLAADADAPPFDAGREAVAMTLAGQAALAIANATLVRTLRQTLDDLTHAQQRLVEGEKLRALGVLAGGMAHHLNNLLTIVIGRIGLLLPRLTDSLRADLRIVERAASDCADVVRRVQVFSRTRRAAPLTAVDVNELARDVMELVRSYGATDDGLRARSFSVELEAGEVPETAGDAAGLREMLMNVVMNAIDAMPDGGAVRLKTWASADRIFFRVTDTGVGMPESVRTRAVEPFFTTKGPKRTGLGLSTSYGIASRHSGTLDIASTPENGTTVTIALPIQRATREAPQAAPARRSPALGILVVEDDRDVGSLVADILGRAGHRVTHVGTAADALARVAAGDAVDLILTDLEMPGMNGWQLAREIRRARPHLPVGMLTAWGDEPPGAASDDDGLVDFVLSKPVAQHTLLAAIEGAVRSRRKPVDPASAARA